MFNFRKTQPRQGRDAILRASEGTCSLHLPCTVSIETIEFAYQGKFPSGPEIKKACGAHLKEIGNFIVILPPEATVCSLVEVDPADSDEGLRWKLADLADFDLATASCRILSVEQDGDSALQKKSKWVAALPRSILLEILHGLDSIGFPRPAIVPEMFWAAGRNESETKASAHLVVGAAYSSLSFVWKGHLLFQKQMDWTTGSQLANDTAFERFTLDIQRNLDYFDRRLSTVGMDGLRVHATDPVGITERLQQFIPLPIAVGEGATWPNPTAASLWLGGFDGLHAREGWRSKIPDLFEPILIEQRSRERRNKTIAAAAGVFLLAAAGGYGTFQFEIAKAKKELDQQQQALKRIQRDTKKFEDRLKENLSGEKTKVAALREELAELNAILAAARVPQGLPGDSARITRFMALIRQATDSSDAWIVSLTYDPQAAGAFRIKARAHSRRAADIFLNRLSSGGNDLAGISALTVAEEDGGYTITVQGG